MKIIPLYRYNRPDGGVTFSPVKPNCEYTEKFRLVADEGMALTDGTNIVSCVDTAELEKWQEVLEVTEETDADEIKQKALAYDIIMGVAE